VFCPNCGTQNDSSATACKKCGFKLSGVSVPKFKGTMMLNSEQTVQEQIEEHRRKQAQAGSGEQGRRASEPPRSSLPPRGPVLQPPRVVVGSKRRMGGTMLGVAPQAGGIIPPDVAAARAAPAEPLRADTPGVEAPPPSAPADPLASTEELPVTQPPPGPRVAAEAPAAAAVADTSAAAVAEPDGEAASGSGDDEAAEEPAPARRPIAKTAALPQHSAPPASVDSQRPAPARLRPLDIALIIVTLGLYAIVLWAKQRKARA